MRPIIRRDYALPYVPLDSLDASERAYYGSIDPSLRDEYGDTCRQGFLEHLAHIAEEEDAIARCSADGSCSPSDPNA